MYRGSVEAIRRRSRRFVSDTRTFLARGGGETGGNKNEWIHRPHFNVYYRVRENLFRGKKGVRRPEGNIYDEWRKAQLSLENDQDAVEGGGQRNKLDWGPTRGGIFAINDARGAEPIHLSDWCRVQKGGNQGGAGVGISWRELNSKDVFQRGLVSGGSEKGNTGWAGEGWGCG